MSLKIITLEDSLLINIIDELIKSQTEDLSVEQYEFSSYNILQIFKDLSVKDPENLYINIIYMNKNCKIGSFAFTYSDKIIKYMTDMNLKSLKKLMYNPTTQEYDSNQFLSKKMLKKKDLELEKTVLSLNLLFDRILLSKKIPNQIFNSDILYQNEKEIYNSDIIITTNNYILVPIFNDSNVKLVTCCKLSDFFIYLLTEESSEYDELADDLFNRFKYEKCLVDKYLS